MSTRVSSKDLILEAALSTAEVWIRDFSLTPREKQTDEYLKNLFPKLSQTNTAADMSQKLSIVSFTSPSDCWLQTFCSQLFSQYCCTGDHETAESRTIAFIVKMSRQPVGQRAVTGFCDFQKRSKSMFSKIPLSPTQCAVVCFQGGNENETLPPVEKIYMALGFMWRSRCTYSACKHQGFKGKTELVSP